MGTKWQDYEQVAAYLLKQFASEFGLNRVEGKQKVAGLKSGTSWEIDAKGYNDGNGGFMIVECRRYTSGKQTQEQLAGLAYRIFDTGASGAILVSPYGLQAGAGLIARAENVFDVRLTAESTPEQFAISFLNKFIAAGSFGMSITGS